MQMTCSIPESLREVANKIARAFDPDLGGDKTFDAEAVDGVISVSFPVGEGYGQGMLALLWMPEELLASVQRDYSVRWPDAVPPTLEEVQEFCACAELVQ